jgi:hypothetical protein
MPYRVPVIGSCGLVAALVLVVSVVHADASISISQKLAESDTSNLSSYTTAGTMSLATGAVGICFVTSGDNTTPVAPALSGGSAATWTQIATVTFDTAAPAKKRLTGFRALGSGAPAATVVADFSADGQAGIAILCYEATGVNVAGTNAADAILQFQTGAADGVGSFGVTLANALQPGNAIIMAATGASSTSWTEEAGYTAGTLTTMASPTMRSRAQWQTDGSDNSPLWTFGGTPNVAGIALELAVSSPPNECDGEDPQDFFNCVLEKDGDAVSGGNITVRGYTMKDNNELEDLPHGEGPNADSGYFYDFANPIDASRVRIPKLSFSIHEQIRFDTNVDASIEQDVLFMIDSYRDPSWRIGGLYCAGTGTNVAQKGYDYTNRQSGGGQKLWEAQEAINGRKDTCDSCGVADGFNGVQPIQLTGITASGTTATATYSGSPAVVNGQTITVSGPTNSYPMNNVSIGTGAIPTLTTSEAHLLTGSFACNITGFTGDSPNLGNVTGLCTVTGPMTMTIVNAPSFTEFRVTAGQMTVAGTGGTVTMHPYSAIDATVSGATGNTFQYNIPGLGSAIATATIQSGGAWAIGNMTTQITGTDCETMGGVRPYPTHMYGGTPIPRPALTSAILPCNMWARGYHLFEFNQGAEWTCGSVTGRYDSFTSYMKRADDTLYRIYDRTEVEFDFLRGINPANPTAGLQAVDSPTKCATYTDIQLDPAHRAMPEAWLEHNSSGGGCSYGNSIPRVGYGRNWLMVTAPNGTIVAGATSLTLNGTELLESPKP